MDLYASDIGARSNDLQYWKQDRSFHVGSPALRTADHEVSDPELHGLYHWNAHHSASDVEIDGSALDLESMLFLLQRSEYPVFGSESAFQLTTAAFS